MRRLTKVALGIVVLNILFGFGVPSPLPIRIEILSSISFIGAIVFLPVLALYLVLTGPRDERTLSFRSFSFGFLGGLIVEVTLFTIKQGWSPLAHSVSHSEPPLLGVLIVGNAPSLLILSLFFILKYRYPQVLRETRLRFLSFLSSLVGYAYGIGVGFTFGVWSASAGVLMFLYVPLSFFSYYYVITNELFLYVAGPLALVTAYVISWNIKGLTQRVISMFLVLILLFGAIGSPMFLNMFG